MGLAIPRPAMRKREAKWIARRLKRHHELMVQLQAGGFSKDDASKIAYDMLLEEERVSK
jgi:hypothetical protein